MMKSKFLQIMTLIAVGLFLTSQAESLDDFEPQRQLEIGHRMKFEPNPKLEDYLPYYERACKGGLATGCFNVGHSYETHKGHINLQTALKYYTQSCDMDFYEGCDRAGLLYIQEEDIAAARHVFQKACSNRLASSCRNLGKLEKKRRRYERAYEFYNLGCEFGDMGSCINKTWLYWKLK